MTFRQAGFLLLLMTLGMVYLCLRATSFELVYPLDDAYIHLAVAGTLADSGTWGIEAGHFASASSSPAWTVILAVLLKILGHRPEVGILASGMATILLLRSAEAYLRWSGRWSGWGLLALGLAVPVPLLVILGMEHALHLALILLICRMLAQEKSEKAGILLGITVLVRLETVFLLGMALLEAIRQRRWADLVKIGVPGVTPALLFSAFSVLEGGSPVPNSILMKSTVQAGWLSHLAASLGLEGIGVWVLIAAVLSRPDLSPRWSQQARLFSGTALLHLLFANVGWYYRYEAWLLGWGVLLLAANPPKRSAIAMLCLPLGWRSYTALKDLPAFCAFRQQADVTVAQFLRDDWNGGRVAMHNIGAAAFIGRTPIYDIAGIATDEVTQMHLHHHLSGESIREGADRAGVKLGIWSAEWQNSVGVPDVERVGWLDFPPDQPRDSAEIQLVLFHPEDKPAVLGMLHRFRDEHPDLKRMVLTDDAQVQELHWEGAAVNKEQGRIAFYTNGTLSFVAPKDGRARLQLAGTKADGHLPTVELRVGGQHLRVEAPAEAGWVEGPEVKKGEEVSLIYDNDTVDSFGNDRNLFVYAVTVEEN